MPMIIEADFKNVLNRLDQHFDRLDWKLEKIDCALTIPKVEMATVKANLTTVKDKLKELRGSQLAQVWAWIGIVLQRWSVRLLSLAFYGQRANTL